MRSLLLLHYLVVSKIDCEKLQVFFYYDSSKLLFKFNLDFPFSNLNLILNFSKLINTIL